MILITWICSSLHFSLIWFPVFPFSYRSVVSKLFSVATHLVLHGGSKCNALCCNTMPFWEPLEAASGLLQASTHSTSSHFCGTFWGPVEAMGPAWPRSSLQRPPIKHCDATGSTLLQFGTHGVMTHCTSGHNPQFGKHWYRTFSLDLYNPKSSQHLNCWCFSAV